MKRWMNWTLVLLLLAGLTACGAAEEAQTPAEPETPETVTEPETPAEPEAEEPETEAPEVQEPAAEPEEEEEPALELAAGAPVVIEGQTLETVVAKETVCVEMNQLAQALGTTWTWELGSGHFTWQEHDARVVAESITMAYGSALSKLPIPPVEVENQVYVAAEAFCEALGLNLEMAEAAE